MPHTKPIAYQVVSIKYLEFFMMMDIVKIVQHYQSWGFNPENWNGHTIQDILLHIVLGIWDVLPDLESYIYMHHPCNVCVSSLLYINHQELVYDWLQLTECPW